MDFDAQDNDRVNQQSMVLDAESSEDDFVSSDDSAKESGLARDAANQHLKDTAIRAYRNHQSDKIADQQIVEYLPMVRKIVSRVVTYLKPPLTRDDLISAGTIGLIKAARDFDSSKDANFKTYAYIRVRGAVIDELRSWSFAPADLNKRVEDARKLAREIEEETGEIPTDAELAGALGISVSKLHKTFENARAQHFLSIHGRTDSAPSLGQLLVAKNTESPGSNLDRQEVVEALTNSIRELDERSRQIIILYYQQELTMKEIAAVMEVTESRVSQLHAAALFKLSVKMSEFNDA